MPRQPALPNRLEFLAGKDSRPLLVAALGEAIGATLLAHTVRTNGRPAASTVVRGRDRQGQMGPPDPFAVI